ncbi:unnamed protein product [Lymnaea stagnalis]|uniref:Uncharacterized protein n=1 Tax=Lymnaea stagnalis TaxID=6523 RepID=A0AAV2IHE8_LYMST
MKWNKLKTTASSLCSERNVHNEMNKCSLHLEQPPEVMDREGCRYQRNFLQCLNRLMRNCPDVTGNFDTILAVSQETFDILCSHVKCPSDVIDSREDIVSFCMKDIEDSSPSTGDYCRKLSEVPKCVEKLRPICPPHLDAYRVDGALSMLQAMLKQNCNVRIR